jgi:hypothetical protein
LQQDPIQAVPVEHQADQVELFEEVEAVDEINEDPVIDLEVRDDDNDDIEIVAEVPAPERSRRRRARREFDDEEYEVESVLDRRYFYRVEFLIKWAGYDDDENSWEYGYEKRVEIPDAISLYFQINGIADDGIMFLRSREEEFVEDRQPRERPFLARAAKRPRFS